MNAMAQSIIRERITYLATFVWVLVYIFICKVLQEEEVWEIHTEK